MLRAANDSKSLTSACPEKNTRLRYFMPYTSSFQKRLKCCVGRLKPQDKPALRGCGKVERISQKLAFQLGEGPLFVTSDLT